MSPSRKKPNLTKSSPRRNGPSEIAPNIYVGGWSDAVSFKGTRFCVLDEAPGDMPSGTHLPIYDDAAGRAIVPNLDKLARAVETARGRGESVLIFCGHGVRRSPLAGAWYLHRSEQLTLDAAYDRILAVRPKVERAQEWVGDTRGLDSPT